ARPQFKRLLLFPGIQPLAHAVVDEPLLFDEFAADSATAAASTRTSAATPSLTLDALELFDRLLELRGERMNQLFLVLELGRQFSDLQSSVGLVIPGAVD